MWEVTVETKHGCIEGVKASRPDELIWSQLTGVTTIPGLRGEAARGRELAGGDERSEVRAVWAQHVLSVFSSNGISGTRTSSSQSGANTLNELHLTMRRGRGLCDGGDGAAGYEGRPVLILRGGGGQSAERPLGLKRRRRAAVACPARGLGARLGAVLGRAGGSGVVVAAERPEHAPFLRGSS
ncbi:hypothetical protein EYF80_049898 [Liparis tanakae]|uniref:Uncharacterized protein n=1 Tax=Liparis tanakae TaxID=230148 RepID=A0A4Z2FG65_9TELE|nr:hypothetical protein EYF80_049898 [Liparis tanakae]